VTGEKTDDWLVKTVGGLLAASGLALAKAGVERSVDPHVRMLAVQTATVLTVVDVVYVSQRRIPPIYLLDAVVHGMLIALWLAARPGAPD
jgi:hypothetical protein